LSRPNAFIGKGTHGGNGDSVISGFFNGGFGLVLMTDINIISINFALFVFARQIPPRFESSKCEHCSPGLPGFSW
jgi:hypothetical protein